MLSPEQQARREGKITASFVPSLMAGDEPRMVREWMRLVEHPAYEPEDMTDNWPVQFGSFIETFALDWHERKTGHPLTDRGRWVAHPERAFVGCTLDAYRCHDDTAIDCKAIGAYRNIDDARSFYCSQMVVQLRCTNAQAAALLIVHGGAEPQEWEVEWPAEYEHEVWRRIDWFWARVESLQPPAALPRVRGPLPAVREVDMSTSNAWCAEAETWLRTRNAATAFNIAAKTLKEMIEPDVQKAHGHGITASRARNGAVTIREGASS